MTDEHPFKSHFMAVPASSPAVPWLSNFRGAAFDRFIAADLPGRKHEEWRFFNVRPILETNWSPMGAARLDVTPFAIEEATTQLVVQNGHEVQSLAALTGLPDGVYVGGLAGLDQATRGVVLDALGSAVKPYGEDLFCALNSARIDEVAVVVVPADTVVETPIHVLFAAAPDAADQMQSTRLVVVGGRGSKFTVIEDYRAVTESRYLTNAVTEFVVGASANVSHVRVQREGAAAAHIGRTGVRVSTMARYDSVSVTLGAASARNDIWVTHEGDDAWARIDGLALVDGDREADTHSVIDNTRLRCQSHQLHKCVVGDRGHAVFNGKIFVRKGAQKTDAYQLNRNLLLAPGARVDTKPQLEIFADDVVCSHGATVGQLDDEQLFYLVSRGISPEEAHATLTYAFAAEVIETIPVPSLVVDLEREAHARTLQVAQ